jgi:hypothetical protein
MTPKRADIVRALKDEAVYMLVRLSSVVPAQRRKAMLTGTKLIELVNDQEQEAPGAPAISGVAAVGLIEAGYLVEAKKRPFGGVLYVLSPSGKALDVPVVAQPSGWDAEQGARVFRSDLEGIAAEFGATVRHNTTRRWWELSYPVGQNLHKRVMLTNTYGQPIARLNELNMNQWREAVTRVATDNGLTQSAGIDTDR